LVNPLITRFVAEWEEVDPARADPHMSLEEKIFQKKVRVKRS